MQKGHSQLVLLTTRGQKVWSSHLHWWKLEENLGFTRQTKGSHLELRKKRMKSHAVTISQRACETPEMLLQSSYFILIIILWLTHYVWTNKEAEDQRSNVPKITELINGRTGISPVFPVLHSFNNNILLLPKT